MKKVKFFIICLMFSLTLTPISLAKVEFTEDLFMNLAQNVNAIPHIEIPDYDKFILKNGIKVYLVEDDQLPIVEMRGYIIGGRSQEDPEIPGVASLMVQMMNTGTANMGEGEFALFKEIHGLDFNISVANDVLAFGGNALSVDQAQLIELVADVLQNPDFEASYFTRNVQEFYQLLAYSLYRDDQLLDAFFNTTLFASHPYGNASNVLAMLQAVQGITPDHLQNYYNQAVDPSNIILTIVGNINKIETLKLLEDNLGGWESQGVTLLQPKIIVDESNFNRIILVHKADATHAKMKMGYNFYDRSFPEKNSFLMANRIFGSGGFSSRLMDILRTKKGFVYGVRSATLYNQLGGLFYITTDVAPDKVWETRQVIKEQLESIKDGSAPITEQELFNNINLYNAFYPQTYKFKISIMEDLIYSVELAGLSENSINEFVSEYNALTAHEAQQVFSKHTYPERFLTVIVGNKEHILPPFIDQGIDVEVIELF